MLFFFCYFCFFAIFGDIMPLFIRESTAERWQKIGGGERYVSASSVKWLLTLGVLLAHWQRSKPPESRSQQSSSQPSWLNQALAHTANSCQRRNTALQRSSSAELDILTTENMAGFFFQPLCFMPRFQHAGSIFSSEYGFFFFLCSGIFQLNF